MTSQSLDLVAVKDSEAQCQMCRDGTLAELTAFGDLPRVTSDCKPWPAGGRLAVCTLCGGVQKIPDARWLEEIGDIYGAYEIYHLSAGAEQVIFESDSGTASPRSRLLVDYVVDQAQLPSRGSLIDIGCGNGAALHSFSDALPGWSLHGSELSDKALPMLQRLPNFVALHTAEPGNIPGKYDLVSMIHSLEHMPAPARTLHEAVECIAKDGTMFIEVPDVGAWPFDLVVADHLGHFSMATLGCLAARVGLATVSLSNTVLTKEITFLGRRDPAATAPSPDADEGRRAVGRALAWLEVVRNQGHELSAARPFGIFGTSISGMWLYGALRDTVDFFVDEDASRIGRHYEGRPILAPADAPAGSTVYVPLIPDIARGVVKRLGGLPARFVPTPAYGADGVAG